MDRAMSEQRAYHAADMSDDLLGSIEVMLIPVAGDAGRVQINCIHTMVLRHRPAIFHCTCESFPPASFEGCLVRKEGKTGPQEELWFLAFEAELGHQYRSPRVDELVALREILLPRPNVLAHECL